MKKALSLFLSILFLLTALPLGAIPVAAATSGTTGDCTWTLDDDGHLTISGNGAMGDYTSYYPSAPWGQSIISVTIKKGVTTIGEYAFYSCDSLTSVTIPDSVTTIGERAFFHCNSLTSVVIPDSVTAITDSSFGGWTSLEAIIVDEKNPNFSSLDGVLFDKNYTTLIKCPGGRSGAYTIPYGVTTIGYSAFQCCQSLTSLTLPDTVSTIEEWAFAYSSLTTMTVGSGVTSVGACAFADSFSFWCVHYNGTDQDRAAIFIDGNNEKFLSATWHYYDNGCDTTCNDCAVTREPIHSYTNACDRDCNDCGITRVAPHKYDGVCDGECNLCGFRRKAEAHTYDGVCDGKCNGCGLEREATEHTYDAVCDAECNGCGFVRIPKAHVYDNTCDTTCNVCGAVREVEHFYEHTCDTDCNVCGAVRIIEHTYDSPCDVECNVCGAVREGQEHVYSDTCDYDCNLCGGMRLIVPHAYDNACDDTCDVCGEYRDVPDHVYDNEYDADCNECGAIREVEMLPVTFGGNSVSKEVSGLAFQFTVDAIGMTTIDRTTAVYDNATVNGHRLLSMGAVVSNAVESVDIPAVYLFDWSDTNVTYAVRLINIPADQYDTTITAIPYFVLEIDGVATTIYGDAQTASMNGVINA